MMKLCPSQLRSAALRAGEPLLLSGVIFAARDAAHARFDAMLDRGEPLPFDLRDSVIYYAGPTDAPPGKIIGSIGPTTAGRMDMFAPRLYRLGLCATIGKGVRSPGVVETIQETGGLYLCAVGGAGALLASCVRSVEVVAFPELGCEAVRRLEVEDMPLLTAVDSFGGNIFDRRAEPRE